VSVEKQEVMGWLRNDTGRSLSSFFFKRGKKLEYVRPGSTFQKIHADKMI
jgi:hypothetical protein